ncbi:MAG: hypothetical protein ACJ788_02245 [Ktedonobacteraceae bacterium]
MADTAQQSPGGEEQHDQTSVTGINLNFTEEETPPLEDQEQTASSGASQAGTQETPFRPLTRVERRNLWLKEYGEQDFALQMWIRVVEQQDLEIEMMFQMMGLLVFGVLINTARYAQFYIDLNEELHRERDPDTADALREYYTALVPPADQPEIGPEGLPVIYRYAHMRDVTIMSAGHKVKVPYWRGRVDQIDAFVIGATPGE